MTLSLVRIVRCILWSTVGYAVTTIDNVLEAGTLPHTYSAQTAELYVMIRAPQLEKVNLQSDSTAVTTYGDPPVVFVGVFNATWWFAGTNKTTYNNSDRFLTIIPNKTPPGMMWQCGGMLYWYLPWNWCGTCTLVYLQPAVTIITDTQLASCTSHAHRIKERDTEEQNPAISEINRFFMTLIPAYGTANLATQVNQLWFSLKNLTDTVLELEGQLETDPELEAVKQMTLQNRMALDLLLAAQGGVCEMVGDHCCTYIPDHKGNYTLIRDKLNAIKQNIMSHQDTWSDFNMSSWFFSGSWRSILIRVCTIILTIFVSLFFYLLVWTQQQLRQFHQFYSRFGKSSTKITGNCSK
uniref:Uncharacterized protein n=1 Tax=Amphiprion percula TaxID=161767 RepID=A0A3P8TLW6_AMPPE